MEEKQYKTGTVILTIDYGYDIHSLRMSKRSYERISAGEPTTIRGQGFRWEGTTDRDLWIFNREQAGALYVTTASGGDIFIGHLSNATVEIFPPAINLPASSTL